MDIPEFPRFAGVDMSLKEVIRNHLSTSVLEASEYTFTNIFAFRKTYNFKASLLNNNLIILKDNDPVSIFCPVGGQDIERVLSTVFDYLNRFNKEPYMERIPESFVEKYLEGNERYYAVEDRDSFDYIYEVKDLVEFSGRRFHDKKNKVNKFRREYKYEYVTLTPDTIDECIEFEDYWCEVRDCEKYYGLNRERCAVLSMLKNYEALNVIGGAIRINNKIAALTIGEQYLPDTMLIHVEKANPDIPGLYQVINQEFLMNEAGDCTLVNREQDLGIEGLRKAKMSYHPLKFIKKYIVKKRK